MSKQPVLWVVEMRANGQWFPSCSARLSREDALQAKLGMLANDPHSGYRAVAYVRRDER